MILANESVGAKAAALAAAGRALGGSFTLLFKIAGDRNDETAMRGMGARAKRAGQDLVDQGFWVMPDGDSVPEPVLVAFSSQTAMRVSSKLAAPLCSDALAGGLRRACPRLCSTTPSSASRASRVQLLLRCWRVARRPPRSGRPSTCRCASA